MDLTLRELDGATEGGPVDVDQQHVHGPEVPLGQVLVNPCPSMGAREISDSLMLREAAMGSRGCFGAPGRHVVEYRRSHSVWQHWWPWSGA